ncbi:hypothetical protein [Hahella sp. KA22]|uniref:hypothetical protein n=1 Tax=Hahella sp. KA22 TaxID=1628392 RepID=UPI0013E3C1CE|nr:hypothetical protein [Hahella sp. KA22]
MEKVTTNEYMAQWGNASLLSLNSGKDFLAPEAAYLRESLASQTALQPAFQ